MRIKKYLRGFLAAFLAVVLTVGCAGGGTRQSESAMGSGDVSADSVEASRDGNTDKTKTGKQLYLGEYTRLLLKDSVSSWEYQDKALYADALDGVVYILTEYRSGEGEDTSRQFFFTTYRNGEKELTWEPFALDFPEKGEWFIQSMAVTGEGELSFRVRESGNGGGAADASDFLAVTDLKGNLLSVIAPFPEEGEYPWNPMGTAVGELVVRGADGSMVLSRKNQEGNTDFYSYDPETGHREKIEVPSDVGGVRVIYPEGKLLYYVDGTGHLFRWDSGEKKLTDVMDLTEVNFPVGSDFAFVLSNGEAGFLLCSLSAEMLQVFTLSEEERHPEDEIRMAILRDSNTNYKLETAVEYSYAHWNCPITTEKAERNEEDAFRDRILVQLGAGQGPDLMLVSAQDVLTLAEKGVLQDLAELIPRETMEQLFPCVVQDGTVDGKMVGLSTELMIETLLTADATWSGDAWTLEEFLKLQEAYGWKRPIGEGIIPMTPMRCLKALLPDLGHSQFLDVEAGTAHFDSEEFVQILEICKNYESGAYQDPDGEEQGSGERMLAQKCGACVTWIMDLDGFSEYLSEYGGKAHLVGYPAEDGGNLTWPNFSYLVVNANSGHKEEIKEYLAMLLDHDRQMYISGVGFSVRRDAVRDSVVMVNGVPCLRTSATYGQFSLKPLQNLKPDGTTYLEEFLDFLEGCRAGSKWPPQIEQILEEELAAYFKGDKSAQDAAGLVQNRVQLYLDERR